MNYYSGMIAEQSRARDLSQYFLAISTAILTTVASKNLVRSVRNPRLRAALTPAVPLVGMYAAGLVNLVAPRVD